MMLAQRCRDEVRSVLRDGFDVVIAGGAVRDPLRGERVRDVDVYLLNCGDEDQQQRVRSEVLTQISGAWGTPADLEPWQRDEPQMVGQWDPPNTPFPFRFQIMMSGQPHVAGLLDSFDWNVSRFAYAGVLCALMDPLDIRPGADLVLHKVTQPSANLRRGYRYSERFGMRLPHRDVVRLSMEILAGEAGSD